MRFLAVIVASCLCVALPALATEVVTDEDRLIERMHAGDVDGARAGFAELVDVRLSRAQQLQSAAGPDAVGSAATYVGLAARALEIWQSSELHLRTPASPTPPQVVATVLDKARRVHAQASQLQQTASARGLAGRSVGSGGAAADVARDKTHAVLLETVAFTRDHASAAERASVLSMARSLGPAPAGVDAFDAANPDVARFLGAAPATPAAPKTPRRQRLHDAGEGEEAMRSLLRSYYEACFDGSRERIRMLLAPGYDPGRVLDELVAEQRGRRLQDLGPVTWRHVGEAAVEVTVGEMRVAGADGSPQTLRDQLVLSRQADGSYRVAFLGTAAQWEASR
ncbi:MAG TPA: hypothetical protein VEC57_06610 [Candidatus Limnocylindrales bacterium]|nr:hypothetical protein [Candidatus Limnocylindrales bacterium]